MSLEVYIRRYEGTRKNKIAKRALETHCINAHIDTPARRQARRNLRRCHINRLDRIEIDLELITGAQCKLTFVATHSIGKSKLFFKTWNELCPIRD